MTIVREPAQVEALLSEILTELKASRANDGDLWTIDQVAAYCQMSKESARRRLVTANGFPASVRLPTTETNGSRPLWYQKEVKAWVRRWKGMGK